MIAPSTSRGYAHPTGNATLRARSRAATIVLIEPLIDHGDVTTVMGLLGDIQLDVQRIRALLEEDDGEEEDSEADS
jgi:hypothetical protein